MKWRYFKEKALDWLFPGLASMRDTARELRVSSEKLKLIIHALGTCPDCEKLLGECKCNEKGVSK